MHARFPPLSHPVTQLEVVLRLLRLLLLIPSALAGYADSEAMGGACMVWVSERISSRRSTYRCTPDSALSDSEPCSGLLRSPGRPDRLERSKNKPGQNIHATLSDLKLPLHGEYVAVYRLAPSFVPWSP